MPDENDKQYLLIVTFSSGEQNAYSFFNLEPALERLNDTENDIIRFSAAVFKCGPYGSVGEKIAERRPMNVAGTK